jgi:hypothetical protein
MFHEISATEQLLAMGIAARADAGRALVATGGDVEWAAEWLYAGNVRRRDLERSRPSGVGGPDASEKSINSDNYIMLLLYSLKRGSVQPGCILGGLWFWGTTIRFFKFVWYF